MHWRGEVIARARARYNALANEADAENDAQVSDVLNAAEELLAVLTRLMARHDPERVGAMDETDFGCIECTAGTVPNSRNTGRCPFHVAALLLLRLS